MLDLYTHEIPCPDDRAMRKFLWYSAFHDARILSVMPAGRYGELHLRVQHGVLQGIASPATYLLRFHGVKHVECASVPDDRLYATIFLDSVALHQEQAECAKPLYHLRIVTWAGYIDLIFERFSIRREGGRMDYRMPEIDDAPIAANRDRRYRSKHTELADRLSSPRPYDMDETEYIALGLRDEDEDEYHAFGLYITTREKDTEAVTAHARRVLTLTLKRHNARTYAAHLLGRCGTAEDLPALTALLLALPTWHSLNRRIMLDAMEHIHERAKEAVP